MMKEVKIKFYPHTDKTSKKTNRIPIYMRITKGSSKTEIQTQQTLSAADLCYWDAIGERLSKPNNELNYHLELICENFRSLRYNYKELYNSFSPIKIKELLFQDSETEQSALTVVKYCSKYMADVILNSREYSQGTVKNYKKSLNHLFNYLEYRKRKKLLLTEVNADVSHDFFNFLKNEIPECRKTSLSAVSASSVLAKIKAIFQHAYDRELINRNPFKSVKLTTLSPKKEELTITEIYKIENLDLTNENSLSVYRDLFLFGVYTGLAYSDITSLTKSNIELTKSEIFILKKFRLKTNEEFKQIMLNKASEIVKKYYSQLHLKNLRYQKLIIEGLKSKQVEIRSLEHKSRVFIELLVKLTLYMTDELKQLFADNTLIITENYSRITFTDMLIVYFNILKKGYPIPLISFHCLVVEQLNYNFLKDREESKLTLDEIKVFNENYRRRKKYNAAQPHQIKNPFEKALLQMHEFYQDLSPDIDTMDLCKSIANQKKTCLMISKILGIIFKPYKNNLAATLRDFRPLFYLIMPNGPNGVMQNDSAFLQNPLYGNYNKYYHSAVKSIIKFEK